MQTDERANKYNNRIVEITAVRMDTSGHWPQSNNREWTTAFLV